MAASQKRLLTQENSPLGKVDIVAMLRQDESWISLPRETREELYALLPPADESEPSRDPDVNPLNIQSLKRAIETELRAWQVDLMEGRETKKWRGEAMQASKDHAEGKFDEYKLQARGEYWGKGDDKKAKSEDEGGVKGDEDEMANGVENDTKVNGRGKEQGQTNGVQEEKKEKSSEVEEIKYSDETDSEL